MSTKTSARSIKKSQVSKKISASKSATKPARQLKNLVIPMEADLKETVKNILNQLGLNQSQVVLALFKEIARTKKIPLSFDLNDAVFAGTPYENAREATPEEAKAIDEALQGGVASQDEVNELEKQLNIKLNY